jgi:hypothetical protein
VDFLVSMLFEITSAMEKKMKEWDSCNPVDVTGAKVFSYVFIPTSLNMVIHVLCDICNLA